MDEEKEERGGGRRKDEEQEGREHAIVKLHCGGKLANVGCCMYTTHCDTADSPHLSRYTCMHAKLLFTPNFHLTLIYNNYLSL